MVESKGWRWDYIKGEDEKVWKEPEVEAYYLKDRWKEQNKKDFLDLGCGLGRHSIFFAKHGFRVHSFDISEEAVTRTKEFAKQENVEIDLKQGDMINIPFEANSIDCIYSKNVVSHTDTEGVKKIISEIDRVLRKEGECYITFCSKDTWGYKQKSWPNVDENTKIRMDKGAEYGIPHFYADYDLIIDLFKEFTIINVVQVENYYNVKNELHKSNHYHVLVRK